MKANAIYSQEIVDEDGVHDRTVHSVHYDGGAFVVSSQEVGLAIQNFLNNANAHDIMALHTYMLYAFKDRWAEAVAQDV